GRLAVGVEVDAAAGGADEGEQLGDLGDGPQLLLDPGQRLRKHHSRAVQGVEGPPHGVDVGGGDAGAAHADDVDRHDDVDALLDDERRDVLGGGGHPAQERQPADADELVDGAVAGEVDAVLQGAVAGQQGAVGQDAAVADLAVVGDVAAGHE